jgi:hypothetical protein
MGSIEDPMRIFHRRFKRVFNEIEYIRVKINKKEGWLFTNHIYTQEELFDSPHHKKIYSVTEKIGDDAENWYKHGKFSDEGKALYYDYRDEVDDELHEINLEIENREPTWWESFKGIAEGFIFSVMDNMPMLKRFLLTASNTLARLPGPVGFIASKIVIGLDSVTKKLAYKTT